MTQTHDPQQSLRATGLLRTFNQAGVLHAADVHVAQRLGRLLGEQDESVLLAAALAVRGTRHGSVMLRLADAPATVSPETEEVTQDAAVSNLPWPEADPWHEAVARSPLTGTTGSDTGRPLHLWDGGLWLDRYWQQEAAVAADLVRRTTPPPVDTVRLRQTLARLWPGDQPDDQRFAAAVCILSRVAVLGGGPGTGKTTTAARLLAALRETAEPGRVPRAALAAPTGKAAARLQEATHAAAVNDPHLSDADRAYLLGLQASTLHRLLGASRTSASFWHDEHRPLPHDVLVVDEASMVSLSLFARLVTALRPTARLILIGDPDQLASVEAGAVLADLVGPAPSGARTAHHADRLREAVPLDATPATTPQADDTPASRVRDGVAILRTVHRFDAGGPIAELAQGIRDGNADQVLEVLHGNHPSVALHEVGDDTPPEDRQFDPLRTYLMANARSLIEAAEAGDAPRALAHLDRNRLLCAHRAGPRGVGRWSYLVQQAIAGGTQARPRPDGRYAGQPLLVTANDYENDLYNGDVGVVMAAADDLVAVFNRGGGPREIPLGRLAEVRPLHAMTIHRSQGSQFDWVTLLMPTAGSPLNTRETLYTAVTRAQNGVRIFGSADAIAEAVARPAVRATGLRQRLEQWSVRDRTQPHP